MLAAPSAALPTLKIVHTPKDPSAIDSHPFRRDSAQYATRDREIYPQSFFQAGVQVIQSAQRIEIQVLLAQKRPDLRGQLLLLHRV